MERDIIILDTAHLPESTWGDAMPVNVGGTVITGGTTVNVTDSSSNVLYNQTSAGIVTKQKTSGGAEYVPMFNVGWGTGGWTSLASTNAVAFAYTGGDGYYNVGGCYNTSTYRFTAPWTGMYLFKGHIYIYGNNSTYSWYTHPNFRVNDGWGTRRQTTGGPYRIRLYGMRATSGNDTDISELIYLVAGDYVTYSVSTNGTVQGYAQYSAWSGAYMGSVS